MAGPNGFSSDMGVPEFRHILRDCKSVAEESLRHVRECQRARVCMCMYCRLMMMYAGEDTSATALRAGSDAPAASVQLRDRALATI